MTAGAYERHGEARPSAETRAAAAERVSDPMLLERVLRQTLLDPAGSGFGDPVYLEALGDVARRHRGAALSLEPVAVDLVRTVLGVFFGGMTHGAALSGAMAAPIAASLCEDQRAHQRLEAMWTRLGERFG